MARPKSEDKRNAILAAATGVFADRGLGAPTSEISRRAGVAEGTLFTYFETKDDLVNTLYRELKLEVAEAMMSGFSRQKGIRSKLQHVWNSYVNWGIANPHQRRVLAQLQLSAVLTEASREAGGVIEIQTKIREAAEQRVLRQDLPLELVSKGLAALAQVTMGLIVLNPRKTNQYRRSGFEMFWAGISRK